jgi:hypothetical protein
VTRSCLPRLKAAFRTLERVPRPKASRANENGLNQLDVLMMCCYCLQHASEKKAMTPSGCLWIRLLKVPRE